MPLIRIIIKNFKSIKNCNISLSDLNLLIGENGTGKTNILEAVEYFYRNLTAASATEQIFDENNRYSNESRIALVYDLSEFVKISKSNSIDFLNASEEDGSGQTKYAGYYRAIISMAERSQDNKLCVELSQVKGRPIRWNYGYEDRLIFKNLFPIFYIDTRSLDVTEWGYVWDILGELGKVSNNERKRIESEIHEILLDEDQEISHKLREIVSIFNASDISVKPAFSGEFAKNLTKVFFSGEMLQHKGKHLRYYSTGTNSVKYIEFLLKAIDLLSKTKLKEPIVLFDEPEISLHTHNLDELSSALLEVNSRMCLVISTHSSRLTKNIVTGSSSVRLYNVKLLERYTHIQEMKKFLQYSPSSKYRVSDDHINSYFSSGILFVEGETELEFFSNPYIRALFPRLKKIDVFKAMSDTPILNIMNPRLTNAHIPYICLIDMDKAVGFDRSSKKLLLKGEYFPANDKERFRYHNKHQEEPYLSFQRRRIQAMQDKLHIHYYLPFVSCVDPSYHAFISAVRRYLLSYNVFSFCTTIEGALINKYTADFALDFLRQKKKPAEYNAFEGYYNSLQATDKINALRFVFNGKSDLLQTWKSVSKSAAFPPGTKLILERVMIGAKTSGWVSEYLDGFFNAVAGTSGDLSERAFRKYLEDETSRGAVLKKFQENFPELYSLIDKLCGIIGP